MEISPVILEAIKIIKLCFGGIDVEIIDKEMSRQYPDEYCPIGYLGVTVLIENENKLFLKYQQCEDILSYGSIKIAESIIYPAMPSIEKLQNELRRIKLNYILNDEYKKE